MGGVHVNRERVGKRGCKDLKTAVAWFENIFSRPADSRPMPELAGWQFNRDGLLQVYQLPERAGSGSFTLAVSDLQEEIRKLTGIGIDTSQQWSGERVKTLMITDPYGNHIAFAEALDKRMAQ